MPFDSPLQRVDVASVWLICHCGAAKCSFYHAKKPTRNLSELINWHHFITNCFSIKSFSASRAPVENGVASFANSDTDNVFIEELLLRPIDISSISISCSTFPLSHLPWTTNFTYLIPDKVASAQPLMLPADILFALLYLPYQLNDGVSSFLLSSELSAQIFIKSTGTLDTYFFLYPFILAHGLSCFSPLRLECYAPFPQFCPYLMLLWLHLFWIHPN